MRAWPWLAAALALGGCARCGGAGDGARAGADAAVARVKHSSDMQTTLLTAFPEPRGTNIIEGRVVLRRRYEALPEGVFEAWMRRQGFAEADGGFVRKPFVVSRVGPDEVTLTFPVDEAFVERAFTTTNSLSTMEMGLYFPRGLPVALETYDFTLHYRAKPERVAYLTRQLVELLLANSQWRLGPTPEGWGSPPDDGGFGEVPERFKVRLEEASRPATMTVRRDGGEVWVHYALVTDAPAP